MKKYLLGLALLAPASFAQQLPLSAALERLESGSHALEASGARVETARQNHKASWGNFLPTVKLEADAVHLDREIEMNLNSLRTAMIQTEAATAYSSTYYSMAGSGATPAVAQATAQQVQSGLATKLDASLPAFSSTFAKQNDWGVDLVAYQPLFHGGKILAAERIASARERSATADLDKQKADLRRDFTKLYLQGALLRQSIALRIQAISSIERHRDQARKGMEQGMVDKASLLRAEMALADAHTQLSDDSAKLQSVALTLGQMSGGTPIVPADTLTRPPAAPASAEELEKQMSTDNALLRSLSAQQDVAHKAVAVKTSDFLPQVGLFGKYQFNHEAARDALQPIWAVGIKGEITLFKGGNDWYSRAAAVSTEREVSALRAEARSALSAQISRQLLTLQQSRTRWDNLSAQIVLAHENHRVTEARFAQGQATGLEVVDAWLLMQKADLERLSAAAEGWMSLNEILWANGHTHDIETHWPRASALSGASR